jgi:hypothetical protein
MGFIFGTLIFEISRVLESLFDEIEYRSAKHAMVKKTKEADRRRQAQHKKTPPSAVPIPASRKGREVTGSTA